MRVVTTLLVVALAAAPAAAARKTTKKVAPPAEAPAAKAERPTDAGWNGDWALTFGLNNVLTQGSVLSSLGGLGTSGVRFLSPTMAVRAGLSLSRTESPESITRTEVTNGGETVVSYSFAAPAGSTVSTAVGGDLLWRLREGPVAPFVGAGVSVSHSLTTRSYTDAITVPDQSTTLNSTNNALTLGLRGILGAEWRFHESFALFAEYQLRVNVVQWNSLSDETIVENTSGGVRTSTRTANERSVPVWGTFNNALVQGGVLGLLVFF